jgi:hypothetical protein
VLIIHHTIQQQTIRLLRYKERRNRFYGSKQIFPWELWNMELLDAVAKRRSIRTYKKQKLPQGTVETLLEAARLAPSAGNVQPWAFLVASTQKTKMDLSQAAFGQKDLKEASVVIVVCSDEKRAAESYGDRGKTLYCIQDTAAAIQNILFDRLLNGFGYMLDWRVQRRYNKKCH